MRIGRNWPWLEEYRNARPTVVLDITKALWLIANDFVDDEQDADDANAADLAPGDSMMTIDKIAGVSVFYGVDTDRLCIVLNCRVLIGGEHSWRGLASQFSCSATAVGDPGRLAHEWFGHS